MPRPSAGPQPNSPQALSAPDELLKRVSASASNCKKFPLSGRATGPSTPCQIWTGVHHAVAAAWNAFLLVFFFKVSTGVIVVLVLQEALLLGAINVSKVNVHVWKASELQDKPIVLLC